MAEGSSPRWCQ